MGVSARSSRPVGREKAYVVTPLAWFGAAGPVSSCACHPRPVVGTETARQGLQVCVQHRPRKQAASACFPSLWVQTQAWQGGYNSSVWPRTGEATEGQRVEGSVPGQGAGQESSESSSPGVLTPKASVLVLLFSHFIHSVSLAPSFPPGVILFPPVSLSASDWVTCCLSPPPSSSSPSPLGTSILFPVAATRCTCPGEWSGRDECWGTAVHSQLP